MLRSMVRFHLAPQKSWWKGIFQGADDRLSAALGMLVLKVYFVDYPGRLAGQTFLARYD